MTQNEMQKAAREFAAQWKDKGDEKQETQRFWIELLGEVLGIRNPASYIEFEKRVKLSHTSFIDAYIPETKVLIEQKGLKIDLKKAYEQSDGTLLTPYEQAKRYVNDMRASEKPRWVVTCNFAEFNIYDMENPQNPPEVIFLKDLEKDFYRLEFLINRKNGNIRREEEISLAAGKLVGKMYDALIKEFIPQGKNGELTADQARSLNILCVRLVFCFYAEDAGLFSTRTAFEDYLRSFNLQNVRLALINLFKALDTKIEERDKYDTSLAPFPYVNGGLFKDEKIEIPNFTQEIADVLCNDCAAFNWSEISPTIFGAVFESTLNPETRRKGGMHYTSIENIHKVIDPLFMDSLNSEFKEICGNKTLSKSQKEKLFAFQKKLGALKFLDPACGSGNFLTETFLSLRRLENKAISLLNKGERVFGFDEFIHVKISQFFGIEINDFAVTVAKTALWIAESQMINETEKIMGQTIDFLPLTTNAFIVEGNALRMDWATLKPLAGNTMSAMPDDGLFAGITTHVDGSAHNYDYIMGNPPFVGARLMSESQKSDVLSVWGNARNIGNADYVSCWYKKAADLIRGTSTKCALVSTNSITQGEQVAIMWKPLFEQGIRIDFAYRTFRWDSESTEKAHVHCVIVGFSDGRSQKLGDRNQKKGDKGRGTREAGNQETGERNQETGNRNQGIKFLIDEKGERHEAKNINGYLLDAPDIFVESRQKPLCNVPEIGIGNKPIDGGNYLFTQDEKDAFVRKEPRAEKYFRKWLGSDEFINRYSRWCLWLGDASPAELVKIPLVMERVKAVREFRLASKSAPTQKLAEKPTRFHVENMPESEYILIPRVSSEKRSYIPIGFIAPDILCSDSVHILDCSKSNLAPIFVFGILTSSVHMAWTRAVCGRLEMRYRYSKDIVYNNFPWPFIKETGISLQETGNRNQEGGYNGSECGGFDNLAEGDGFDGGSLCADEASAEGGAVFAPGPDEKGFGVGSVEYRGRLRTEQSQGIPQVSADSARLGDGAGNAAENMREDRLSFGEGRGKASRTSGRNQENGVFAHKLQKLSPDSCVLSSAEIQRIEAAAQAILDARAKYPELSLAELYGENMFMFPELEKAHRENDHAVMQAYGFPPDLSESEIVSRLFEMYEKMTQCGCHYRA